VCDFFAVFARLEFVLKDMKLVEIGRAHASADWDRFSKDVATWLKVEERSDLDAAITYLNDDPPQTQTRELRWEQKPLGGHAPVEKALQAVRRVRNNLFHGGKHTPHYQKGAMRSWCAARCYCSPLALNRTVTFALFSSKPTSEATVEAWLI
jgi:hypothetical protein